MNLGSISGIVQGPGRLAQRAFRASTQEKHFSRDKNGALIAPVCWDCGDRALSLRPGSALTLLCAIWRGDRTVLETDPTLEEFPQEMRQAQQNIKSMQSEGMQAKDMFSPNGGVSELHSYGIRIYQTYALVTESEYQQLIQYNPTEIKTRQAFSLPFKGPLQNLSFWLLDLKDIDPCVAQALRKCDVYYNTETELQQIFLHADQQVQKDQPWAVFRHCTARHFDKRPDPLRPAAKRPDTVAQLVESHLIEKANRSEQVAAAAKGTMAEQPGHDAEKNLPGHDRKLGLGADDSGPVKKRRQPKKAVGPVFDAGMRGGSPSKAASMTSMTSSKAARKADDPDIELEQDMALVAAAHLSTSSGTSVKSLNTLSDPLAFLLAQEAAVKTCSNAIMSVGNSAVT